jgi:hypothetical protein
MEPLTEHTNAERCPGPAGGLAVRKIRRVGLS